MSVSASDLVLTQGVTPSVPPPTGTSSIYFKSSDGQPYTMDDAGTETSLVGPTGATGSTGATGAGVPTGGTAAQVLVKNSATNFDTLFAPVPGPVQVSLTGAAILGAVEQSVEVNSASPCTVTLPAASAMVQTLGGNKYASKIIISNTGTTLVTVAANGSETIRGVATNTDLNAQWRSITLYSNAAGTGWIIA